MRERVCEREIDRDRKTKKEREGGKRREKEGERVLTPSHACTLVVNISKYQKLLQRYKHMKHVVKVKPSLRPLLHKQIRHIEAPKNEEAAWDRVEVQLLSASRNDAVATSYEVNCKRYMGH